MGDAFYRWDGFSYYASISEFLPSVALAFILWSIIALATALLLWLSFRTFEKTCYLFGLKIIIEHLLFFATIFILLGVTAWKVKKLIWPLILTSFHVKLIVLLSIALLSIFLAYLFRNSASRLAGIVLERITPLVWLFGIIAIFSVPLVAYQTWWEKEDKAISEAVTPSSTVSKNLPNIILLTFDALTARDMSLYGYHRVTTPFMSEWAKNATVFSTAEAESNFTTSATASLMTGKRVWTHQTYHIEGTKPVNSHTESLPSLLKTRGYYNMAFIVNPHTSVQMLGMSNSFDIAPLPLDFSTPVSLFGARYGSIKIYLYRLFSGKIRLYDWILKNDFILHKLLFAISNDFYETPVPPEKAFNRFLNNIDNNIQRPYFAWIHIFPPHDPYLPIEPYKGFFNSSHDLMNYKAQEEIKTESYKYLFQYKEFPEKDMRSVALLRDYYNDFIRYCDDKFKDFYGELVKRNELENTIVVLSADHGESFEHGYFTHGGPFLFEQVTHIPLVIKRPGQDQGRIIDDLVEQIDIPATILDMAGITVPSWMEGRSLIPLIRGEELPPRPAFAMNFEGNRSRGHQITRGSIAVWEGDYKMIHYLERNESLFFNIKADPGELFNIIDHEPEKTQYMHSLIQNGLENANERIRGY